MDVTPAAWSAKNPRVPNKAAKTPSQVRKWTEARIRAQEPKAVIEWREAPHKIVFPTGMRGVFGQVKISAPGWADRHMIVTSDPYGTSTV